MRRQRPLLLPALTAVLVLLLAACGGGGDGGAETTATDSAAGDAAGDPGTDAADGADADEPTADAEPTAGGDADDADDAGAADGEPITVGVVTSTSGPLGSYGEMYLEGLEAGLDHATDGTGAVDGRPIELEVVDDGGEPDQAIAAATDLIGRGVTILAGTASSGIAVQLAPFAEENDVLYISGPAATDALTGINRNTFRSGRQTYQDVATAATLVDELEGASVMVFAQDSEFGAGNVAGVEAVLGAGGAEVESLLVPLNTTEFTPFAQQVVEAAPDLLFVAWAGETAPAMWQALEQQGVPEEITVTTGLADRAVWDVYATGVAFLSHYFPEAADNPVNQAMLDAVDQADLFTPDGFVAAQMIVRALSEAGPDDVDGMISALEGWSFEGPKGPTTVRAGDHALLQPMFAAELTGEVGSREAQLIEALDPEAVAPPEAG